MTQEFKLDEQQIKLYAAAPDMFAFIEKVVSSEYSRDTIMEAQDKALELIKKVKGIKKLSHETEQGFRINFKG